YDNVGNVSSITDPRPNATQTFVPDALDRLTNATGPWGTLDWIYDAAGNRLSETASGVATTYTYNTATQRLMSTSGGANETFEYASVGRVKSDAMAPYAYSPAGRLATATGSGVNASYAYDTAGERFSKTVNGQTTYSLRSMAGQTLSEYTGSCGSVIWSRDLLYAGGQLIGAAKAVTTQPSVAMVASSASVNEHAGTVTISVRLTTPNGGALGCPVTVSYATSAGTATAGADYTQTTGNITFATGAASGSTQSFTIPILNDAIDEPNETFSVGLSSAAGATVAPPSATTVTIVDDDPPLNPPELVRGGDFDGDWKSDITVYDTLTGVWSWLLSSSGYITGTSVTWGGPGYDPVPGDYDGDGKADLGVYQVSTGNWSVLLSSTNFTTSLSASAGGAGWVPVPGDY